MLELDLGGRQVVAFRVLLWSAVLRRFFRYAYLHAVVVHCFGFDLLLLLLLLKWELGTGNCGIWQDGLF